MEIGFAVCGSFCTYSIVFPVMEQLSREHHVTPIFSDAAYSVDSRFGTAREHIVMAETICGTPPLHTLAQVEPVGPKSCSTSSSSPPAPEIPWQSSPIPSPIPR